jgi:hypothetical protein
MQPQSMQPAGAPAPSTPNPGQNVAIALGAIALVILIGTFTKSWFAESERGGDVGLGLLGMKACFGGQCMDASWGDMKGSKIPGDIPIWGYLGFIGGLAAAGACGFAAFMAFTRSAHKLPAMKLLQIPLGVASLGMTAFFVRILTEGKDTPSPSYSGFLAIGGVIAAGVVMKKMLEPLMSQPAALPPGASPAAFGAPPAGAPMGASPVAAPSACPRCNGAIEYVAQYQRYFCRSCNQYV